MDIDQESKQLALRLLMSTQYGFRDAISDQLDWYPSLNTPR